VVDSAVKATALEEQRNRVLPEDEGEGAAAHGDQRGESDGFYR
jgi:hypothetical protein